MFDKKEVEPVYVMCDWCRGKGREFDDKLPENGMQCRNCRGTGKVDASLLTITSADLRDAYLRTAKSESYMGRTISSGDMYKNGVRYIAKYGDGLGLFGDKPVDGEPTDRDLMLNRFRYVDKRKSISYYTYDDIIKIISRHGRGYIDIRTELNDDYDFEIKLMSHPSIDAVTIVTYLRPIFTAANWVPDESESNWQLDKYGIFFDYAWSKVLKDPRSGTVVSTEKIEGESKSSITVTKKDFSGGNYTIDIDVTANSLMDDPADILEIGDTVAVGHGTIGTIIQICGSGEFIVQLPNESTVSYIQTRYNNKV